MRLAFALASLLLAFAAASSAHAQSAGERPTESSLLVLQSLKVGALNATRVEVDADGATLAVSAISLINAPALIQVSGDANRVYRIQVAGPVAVTQALKIVSANSGDITVTHTAAMDEYGRDLLQITGDVSALCTGDCTDIRVPLSVAYE